MSLKLYKLLLNKPQLSLPDASHQAVAKSFQHRWLRPLWYQFRVQGRVDFGFSVLSVQGLGSLGLGSRLKTPCFVQTPPWKQLSQSHFLWPSTWSLPALLAAVAASKAIIAVVLVVLVSLVAHLAHT